MSASASAVPRVPIEHRVLGMDRRSFPYALFVVAVFLVATVLVPWVDDQLAWDDPVAAGDQIALTSTIVFTPTTGWDVESGHRVGETGPGASGGPATVTGEGVTFSVVPDAFDGTPAELLTQIEKVTSATSDPTFKVAAHPVSITTPAGDVGVVQTYSSVNGDGLIAAFVIDGTGLKVTAYGSPEQMNTAAADIATMISSITQTDGSAS